LSDRREAWAWEERGGVELGCLWGAVGDAVSSGKNLRKLPKMKFVGAVRPKLGSKFRVEMISMGARYSRQEAVLPL